MGRIIPEKPAIRTLQSIKKGSFTITLPKWWVEKHGLGKGSKLFLNEDGYSLRIVPVENIMREKGVEIDYDAYGDFKVIRYMILTYYMQGVNRISIRLGESVDINAKQLMREMRLEMPGAEIVRDDSEYLVYNIPTHTYPEKLDELILQLHNLALTAHRESVNSIVDRDLDLAIDVINREGEMLRIYRKLIRNITLCSINPSIAEDKGVKNSRELLSYVLASRDLNRIVYHSIYIARHSKELGGKGLDGEIIGLIRDESDISLTMQAKAVDAFIKMDYDTVLEVSSLMPRVRELENKLDIHVIKSIKDIEAAHKIMMVGREIRRIAGFSVAIADAAANRILYID